jgi:hypothetical protein
MKAWFDGYCKPNPNGIATYGYVIRSDTGKLLKDDFGTVGVGEGYRSNVAEFEAIRNMMVDLVKEEGYIDEKIYIYGDCRPIIGALKHHNECSDASKIKNRQIREILDNLDVNIEWISSRNNGEADALSRRAYAVEKRNRNQKI